MIFAVVINDGGGNGAVAVEMTEHGDHAVIDQVMRHGDGLLGVALVVERDGLDLLAEHAALGVPLVDGDLRAVEHGRADLGIGARLHRGQSDFDRVWNLFGSRRAPRRPSPPQLERGKEGVCARLCLSHPHPQGQLLMWGPSQPILTLSKTASMNLTELRNSRN